jgi:hypothetical protein
MIKPNSRSQRGHWKKVPYLWNHQAIQGFCLNAVRGTSPRPGQGIWGKSMNERKPVGQQKPMETAETRDRKASDKPAKLSREVQARLGQQLRTMYDEVVNQGVPDRFTELLNNINDAGKKDEK